MPTLAVVIPTVGKSRHIHDSFESCLSQTQIPDQIVLICNGIRPEEVSADQMEREAINAGIKFSIVQHASRLSIAKSWFSAVSVVDTYLVAYLADDDIYEPTYCQVAREAFDNTQDLDVFASNVIFIDSSGMKTSLMGNETRNSSNVKSILTYVTRDNRWFVNTPPIMSICFRSDYLRERTGFADYGYVWDEWSLREMAVAGYHYAYESRPLVRYRLHETQATAYSGSQMDLDAINALSRFEKKFGIVDKHSREKCSQIAVTMLFRNPLMFAIRVVPTLLTKPLFALNVGKLAFRRAIHRSFQR